MRFFSEENQTQQRRPRRERSEPEINTTIVLVRGLPWERYNSNDITSLFQPLQPKQIHILKDHGNDKPNGLVFVEFSSVEDVRTALRQTRAIAVDGRNVFVRPASEEEFQEASNLTQAPSNVVCVKRVPFYMTADEVRGLFQGFNPETVVCENGNAYLRFKTQEERQKALTAEINYRDKKLMIVPSSEYDLKRSLANPSKVVRVRGAPNGASEEEIRAFFQGHNVTRVNFTTRESVSGKVLPGDIFVEFATAEEATRSLQLDRQNLGDRYLRISKSAPKERRLKMTPRNEQREEADTA